MRTPHTMVSSQHWKDMREELQGRYMQAVRDAEDREAQAQAASRLVALLDVFDELETMAHAEQRAVVRAKSRAIPA